MVTQNNQALHEEALSQRAQVIPPRENESLFNWIENTGRFKSYESEEPFKDKGADELEEIMGTSAYELEAEEEAEEWDL